MVDGLTELNGSSGKRTKRCGVEEGRRGGGERDRVRKKESRLVGMGLVAGERRV